MDDGVLISAIHRTLSRDNKVQTCFRAQSGWTSCLSSLLQIVVSSGSLSLSQTLSLFLYISPLYHHKRCN